MAEQAAPCRKHDDTLKENSLSKRLDATNVPMGLAFSVRPLETGVLSERHDRIAIPSQQQPYGDR